MLLFDQNLSDRLARIVAADFPGSAHVKDLDLSEADDGVIWERAARDGFAIVSKDADFHYLSLLKGHPPKLIYLCLGNCPTSQILALLDEHVKTIKAFLADPKESLLMF